MQICRDRRRRRHRVRQPEVKRKLRAFRQSTEKDQDERRDIERVRADDSAGREHSIEIVAANDMPEHQHAGEQAKSARRRDDQRHPGAIPRLRCLMPVADQQEGKQAGQFPEEDQLDQVARKHDAKHRAHECQQEREEARDGIGGRHVVARVQHHQESDAGDQSGEHPSEAVHPQTELEAEFTNPRRLVFEHSASAKPRVTCKHQHESDQRDDSGEVGLGVAGICAEQGRKTASGKGQRDERNQECYRRDRHSLSGSRREGRFVASVVGHSIAH